MLTQNSNHPDQTLPTRNDKAGLVDDHVAYSDALQTSVAQPAVPAAPQERVMDD
jgi:hypothetical protein